MDIKTVAVIGGGSIGSGIAIVTAKAGLKTVLTEKTAELADAAAENINKAADRQIARWAMTESEKKFVLANLDIGYDLSRSEHAQLIISTIPTMLGEQKRTFHQLSDFCSPDTIFTSSNSVVSITELAAEITHPENMIGLHFLPPVLETKLVEIVRGYTTSDDTYENAKNFVETLGRTSIEVFESPGYVTGRIIFSLVNEAMYVLSEGVASAEDIDKAITLGYNMEIGPLELADRTGLDRFLMSMEYLFKETGDTKFRPCPLIKKLVRAKHLGVKTGKGIFTYDKTTGKRIPD